MADNFSDLGWVTCNTQVAGMLAGRSGGTLRTAASESLPGYYPLRLDPPEPTPGYYPGNTWLNSIRASSVRFSASTWRSIFVPSSSSTMKITKRRGRTFVFVDI